MVRTKVRPARWLLGALLVMDAATIRVSSVEAAPRTATNLNDLCPGVPDPCEVTGKFIVPSYTEFDAGGRQFVMKSGSSLTSSERVPIGAFFNTYSPPIVIRNASSIELEKGSRIHHPWTEPFGREITLQSTGSCTIDGTVFARFPHAIAVECAGGVVVGGKIRARKGNVTVDGGALGVAIAERAMLDARMGTLVIEGGAAGVAIGERAKLDVRSTKSATGTLVIDGGSGGITIGERAKLDVRGLPGGNPGGSLTLETTGACQLGGQLLAEAPVLIDGEFSFGGGGDIDITCSSVSVLPKAKVVSASRALARGARLRIAATDGTVDVGESALLNASGYYSPIPAPDDGLQVTAKGRCILDGRVVARGASWPMEFVCAGFDVGPKAILDAGGDNDEAYGGVLIGGGIMVDTTGATSGEPPADCLIRGALLANADDALHIRLACGTTLEVLSGAKVAANGRDYGGHVELFGGTTVTVESGATVSATGSGPRTMNDGVIDVIAPGDVTIGGTLNADSQLDYDGGTINIEGCDVTITANGSVSTRRGWQGRNTLIAHDTLRIAGRVSTTFDEGVNTLTYRNGVDISSPSLIVPSTTPTQDLGLGPCP